MAFTALFVLSCSAGVAAVEAAYLIAYKGVNEFSFQLSKQQMLSCGNKDTPSSVKRLASIWPYSRSWGCWSGRPEDVFNVAWQV